MRKLVVLVFALSAFFCRTSTADYYVLAMGQSNMMGWDFATYRWDPRPDVLVWNYFNQQWESWDLWSDPPQFGQYDMVVGARWQIPGENNMAWWFAACLADATGQTVRVVFEAEAGTPLYSYESPDGLHFLHAKEQMDNSGTPKIDAFIWHHGEIETQTPTVEYVQRFDAFVDAFMAEGYFDESTRIVCGELAKTGIFDVQNAFYDNPSMSSHASIIAVAKIGDYPTISDQYHFSGDSLEAAGREYCKQYLKMMGMTACDSMWLTAP